MADITKQDVEIEVLVTRTEESAVKVATLKDQIDNLKLAGKKVPVDMKQSFEKWNATLKSSQSQLRGVQQQMEKTRRSTGYLGTSVAYLASDIGFLAQSPRMGLLAIGNNLSQVSIAMGTAAKEAGSFGKALKIAFATQGWMIALQLTIALVTQLPVLMKKFRKETDEASESIKKLESTINSLAEAIKEENEALKEQVELRKDTLKLLRNTLNEGNSAKVQRWLKNLGDIVELEDWDNLKKKEKAKLLDELIEKYGDLDKIAKDMATKIAHEETNDKIAALFGLTDNAGKLRNSADIAIQKLAATTGKSYGEAKALYWASPKGKLIAAKIQKAELDAMKEAAKESDSKFEEYYAQRMAEAKMRIAKRSSEIQKQIAEQNEYFRIGAEGLEYSDPFAVDENAVAGASSAVDQTEDVEEDAEFKLLVKKGQALRAQRAYQAQQAKTDFQIEAELKIARLKELYQNELLTEAQFEDAKKRIKQQAITSEIRMRGQQLQQLHALTGKFGGLAIAGVIVDQGAAMFDIVKGVTGRIKAIKNLPDPTGISQGLLIAKAVGEGVLEGGIVAATAASSIKQIKQASGASGPGSGGGGGGPKFNIIGQNSNNALQQTIQEQTGVIQNTPPPKIVIVQSELQAKEQENRTAVKTATIFD